MNGVEGAGTTTSEGQFFTNRIKEGLCGRILPYWRMSAGIICLAASIIAICTAIIWNATWLCIPFGLSAAASGYLIYLGYHFHDLKSLKAENQTYHDENTRHENLLKQLREENEKLNKTIEEYNKQLTPLVESLTKITESATNNHQTLGTHINTFSDNLKTLEQILDEINKWKDDNLIQKIRDEQNLLSDTRKEVQIAASELATTKAQIEQYTKQLEEIKNKLDTAFKSFFELADKGFENFETETKELANIKEEFKQIAKEFQKIPTKQETE